MKWLVVLLSIAASLPNSAALLYSIQRLDGVSHGWDLNDYGTVVGEQEQPFGGPHGVIWRQGVVTDLGLDLQVALAVNNSDVVVGRVRPGLGSLAGFRWESGVVTQLSSQQIVDINDGGDMVFQRVDGSGPRAMSVNNGRWLVGGAPAPPLGREHATLWTGAEWDDTGTFVSFGSVDDTIDVGVVNPSSENSTSVATAVSDAGVVVGNDQGTAFRWFEGQLSVLPLPSSGFVGANAVAINERGEIVGSLSAAGRNVAMYFNDQLGMVDLNTLIIPVLPLFGQVDLRIARAINEHGLVLATGFDAAGRQQAYLLTPISVYAPSGLALGLAIACFGSFGHVLGGRRRCNA